MNLIGKTKPKRNPLIDYIRGFAMLLVVLGHTLAVSTLNYQGTVLFNIIWTLQMPLFMVISGYVTNYSARITSCSLFFRFVKKKSLAYLLPWIVWSFIIRGFLLNHNQFLDIPYLLWHMDSGYWFLFSLWVISLLFGLGHLSASKLTGTDKKLFHTFLTVVLTCCFSVPLILIAIKMGFNFLGIKLTLYYIPFYLLGFVYSQIELFSKQKKWFEKIREIIVLTATIVYCFLISRYKIAQFDDSAKWITIRIIASVTGVISVFGFSFFSLHKRQLELFQASEITLCGKKEPQMSTLSGQIDDDVNDRKAMTEVDYNEDGELRYESLKQMNRRCDKHTCLNYLSWIGKNTIGIYLVHTLFLNSLRNQTIMELSILPQFMLVIVNYSITVVLSSIVVYFLSSNRACRKLLFGMSS